MNNAINTTAQKMGVKIISHKTNQIVPKGPLTIKGTSSDTPNTNCQVYVDWNDTKPMQNVTATGPGGPNDYSSWTFTYTQNYHLITTGTNELTSKITCNHESPVGNVTTKYYSINITGTDNAASFSPTKSTNSSSNSTTGFYNARFNPLLPQYSNSSRQSLIGDANISNTTSEAASFDNVSDNTHLIKEKSSDDKASSSEKDGHDNHDSSNHDRSNSDDSKDNSNDNKDKSNDNSKVEIHTVKHLKSTKVEKTSHEKDKFNSKHHNDNTKSGDLHNYIHNLIKEKIKKATERIFD